MRLVIVDQDAFYRFQHALREQFRAKAEAFVTMVPGPLEIRYYMTAPHDDQGLGRHYRTEWELAFKRLNALISVDTIGPKNQSRIEKITVELGKPDFGVPLTPEVHGLIEIRRAQMPESQSSGPAEANADKKAP